MNGDLGQNELYLAVAILISFAVCWSVPWIALRQREDALRRLVDKGNLLRLMTVAFVIGAALCLAVINRLSPEVSTLLAGVAGYVLGGIQKSPTEDGGRKRPPEE